METSANEEIVRKAFKGQYKVLEQLNIRVFLAKEEVADENGNKKKVVIKKIPYSSFEGLFAKQFAKKSVFICEPVKIESVDLSSRYLIFTHYPLVDLYKLQCAVRLAAYEIKFYGAEIVSAIACIHKENFLHLDLKLANVLIGNDGHVLVTDFGWANPNGKLLACRPGTKSLNSPEIVAHNSCTYAADWYSLGVMLYMLYTMQYPYEQHSLTLDPADDPMNDIMIQNSAPKVMPPIDVLNDWQNSYALQDLILKFLIKDPNMRLGTRGVEEVMIHPFFSDIIWDMVEQKLLVPPYRLNDQGDVINRSNLKVQLPYMNI